MLQKSSLIILHCVALLVINVISYWLGTRWSLWAHDRHPSAAAIPLVAAIASLGFLCWYHTANGLTGNLMLVRNYRSWGLLYGLCLIAGGLTYCLLSEFLTGHAFSKGRMVAFGIYQAVCNALILGIAVPQREFNSAALFRSLLKRPWFRTLFVLTTFVVFTGVLLAFVELLFLMLNSTRPPGPVKVYEGEYLTQQFSDYDPDLGKKLMPDADVLCRLKVDDETIWDVRYTTDKYGRRTTTHPESPAPSQYAIFFGCSFLFGEGANDSETIPSQFAAAAPQYRAYNYGVPGYGTQHMLAKLESGTIRDEITEQDGVVFYLYLEDVHEPRVIGDMQLTNSFAQNFPYYDFNEHGELQRFGSFTTGRPAVTNLYHLLGKSQFVRYMGLNFPKSSRRHEELVASVIERSRQLCHEQLSCKSFYVVCYPHVSPHRRILPLLESRRVAVIDERDLFDPNDGGNFHRGDGHPSPAANKTFAKSLATSLMRAGD